ncbi:MAG: LysM peptidoglycan-binding domain-containing protein [Clostridia bacterium]|nr:LysM peptidoglycan-binding domain-containing protein [Clostridia bacterium]
MTGNTRNPQDRICAYEYTVKRGDSFYLIAHRLGVPLRDLLEANSDINPARLMVGDVLCIPMEEDDAPQTPAQPAPEPEPETPDEEAQPDFSDGPDDLDQPAQPDTDNVDPDMGVCPQSQQRTVVQGETITDIQLETDLTLHTLQSANPDADLDALTEGQVLCMPQENIPCPVQSTMIIPEGENIESLALKLDTSVGALLRANPCLAPSGFTAGACIRIPGR